LIFSKQNILTNEKAFFFKLPIAKLTHDTANIVITYWKIT